jgi:cytochrome c peroxidase
MTFPKRSFIIIILFMPAAWMVFGMSACKKDKEQSEVVELARKPVLPQTPFNYSQIELPDYFSSGVLSFFESIPSSNPTTDAGATLGRVLFYDTELSADGTVSCASCHHQSNAFAASTPFSEGIGGASTVRNSMALFNLRYSRRFFWDRRTNGLEAQVLIPIEHPDEQALDLDIAAERVASISYYPELFEAAFGDAAVTSDRISKALSQFIRSMLSYRSKYDSGLANNFVDFTEQELLGKELFFNGETRCNQCHMTALFYTPGSMNNGLEYPYTDLGVGAVTGNSSDNGKFKVVTLRNLSYTAPYMHDGRFTTLEEVVNHYNGNIVQQANLDDRLTVGFVPGGTPIDPDLGEAEVAALVSFLRTLDDVFFVSDEMYSDPF